MPTTILRSLGAIALFQAGIVILAALGLLKWGSPQLAASFAVGGGLMLLNLGAIAWSTWRILDKKPIASTVLIIVIKYALLLGSMFYFARADWFNALGAGLGVASFVLAVLGGVLLTEKED
jgi:hypothetical protein